MNELRDQMSSSAVPNVHSSSAFRLKRNTYRAGAIFAALAALYPLDQVFRGNPDFGTGHLVVCIPLFFSAVSIAVMVQRPQWIRVAEWLMTISVLGTVFFWDVVNLVLNRSPEVVLGATEPLVVTGCLMLAVTLPSRWFFPTAWGFWILHLVLSWANLATFPWQIQLTNHVINDLVTTITFAAVGLLSVYQRLMGAASAQTAAAELLANTDPLTQVANRRRLSAVLTENPVCTIVLADLDNFKKINDIHGHDVGDEVLVRTAQVFSELFPAEGVVGRWGGEEFLAVLPGDRVAQVRAATESVQAQLRTAAAPFSVTLSAGVTVKESSEPVHQALSRADSIMYLAKRSGKDQVRTCLTSVIDVSEPTTSSEV